MASTRFARKISSASTVTQASRLVADLHRFYSRFHAERVATWLGDKRIDTRFGRTAEGQEDQTGFLLANEVLPFLG